MVGRMRPERTTANKRNIAEHRQRYDDAREHELAKKNKGEDLGGDPSYPMEAHPYRHSTDFHTEIF